MQYWLVVTSPENFKLDRETLQFNLLGFSIRHKRQLQNMDVEDKVVYYIMGLQKFGAVARVTGGYVVDDTKVWTEDNEMWPARRSSELEIRLLDDELIDARKLMPDLSFIEKKDNLEDRSMQVPGKSLPPEARRPGREMRGHHKPRARPLQPLTPVSESRTTLEVAGIHSRRG